jgi:hypothetical protein
MKPERKTISKTCVPGLDFSIKLKSTTSTAKSTVSGFESRYYVVIVTIEKQM